MISFGKRTEVKVKAVEETKAVSPQKEMPSFQTIFMRNSTFIKNGLNRNPPVKFTTEGVCQSIFNALMADYVYEKAQEWVKDEETLMRRNSAACLFIAWAHHIGSREYGICNHIDFMIPSGYTVIIDASIKEALDTKVQAYLKDLSIGSFQKLLLEIANDCEKIRIEWKMFQDKFNPEKLYPHDFIQWIGRPIDGVRKKYYRLTHIDPRLTCGRILELTIAKILADTKQ